MNMIKPYVHGFQFCYGGDISVGWAKGLVTESCWLEVLFPNWRSFKSNKSGINIWKKINKKWTQWAYRYWYQNRNWKAK